MPYSALLVSTVNTCLRHSTSSCFLLVAMHLALCSLACRPFVADNSGSTRLVLLVTKHLALYSLFPSSGPRCATSWPVWTRRTVRRCIPVVVQRPIPMVFSVQKVIEFPCCSSTSPLYLAVTCTCSVFACGVQDYGLFCEILQEWFPYSTLLGSTGSIHLSDLYLNITNPYVHFHCA